MLCTLALCDVSFVVSKLVLVSERSLSQFKCALFIPGKSAFILSAVCFKTKSKEITKANQSEGNLKREKK